MTRDTSDWPVTGLKDRTVLWLGPVLEDVTAAVQIEDGGTVVGLAVIMPVSAVGVWAATQGACD